TSQRSTNYDQSTESAEQCLFGVAGTVTNRRSFAITGAVGTWERGNFKISNGGFVRCFIFNDQRAASRPGSWRESRRHGGWWFSDDRHVSCFIRADRNNLHHRRRSIAHPTDRDRQRQKLHEHFVRWIVCPGRLERARSQ